MPSSRKLRLYGTLWKHDHQPRRNRDRILGYYARSNPMGSWSSPRLKWKPLRMETPSLQVLPYIGSLTRQCSRFLMGMKQLPRRSRSHFHWRILLISRRKLARAVPCKRRLFYQDSCMKSRPKMNSNLRLPCFCNFVQRAMRPLRSFHSATDLRW